MRTSYPDNPFVIPAECLPDSPRRMLSSGLSLMMYSSAKVLQISVPQMRRQYAQAVAPLRGRSRAAGRVGADSRCLAHEALAEKRQRLSRPAALKAPGRGNGRGEYRVTRCASLWQAGWVTLITPTATPSWSRYWPGWYSSGFERAGNRSKLGPLFAVAPGIIIRGICVPRTATGTGRRIATTITASGLSRRPGFPSGRVHGRGQRDGVIHEPVCAPRRDARANSEARGRPRGG